MAARLVGLKWRLLINGLRHDVQRRVGLPLLVGFLAYGSWWLGSNYWATGQTLTGAELAEFSAWAALLAWLVWSTLPVLLFPVDEVLSPEKLALLPISDSKLVLGLLGAGIVTPPIVAPLVLTVTNLRLFITPASAVIAVAASLVLLAHLVVGAQGFSALVTMVLRSARGRDLVFLVIGGLGFSGFLLQQLIATAIGEFGVGGAAAQYPISRFMWLIPPVGAQTAIADAAAGDLLGAAVGLAVSTAWLAIAIRLWLAAIKRLVTTPEAPIRQTRTRSTTAFDRIGWGATGVVAAKELRFYLRDPRMRMVWTGGVVFLGILGGSIALGSTQLNSLQDNPALTMAAPAVVLFIGLPIALNQFGWERNAASFLFALPIRPLTMLLGKNLATGIALAAEATLLSLIFAFFTNGWAFLVYVPPLIITAICCQLAVGNLVSVLTPLRLPPPGTDLFSQATEQGCLALGSQLVAFAGIGLIMVLPAAVMVLVSGLFGTPPLDLRIGLTAAVLVYGLVFYALGLWGANSVLRRRLPEMVSAVQTV